MGLWIAVFITLAVFGSILWVKPSPRERTLTQIRNAALSKGIKVRLLDEKLSTQLFPWIDNYRQFVFYEKALPNTAKPNSNKAIVIRLSEDLNAHELDVEDPIRKSLSSIVSFTLLPKTAEALVISASGISIVWREYQDEAHNVFQQLELIDSFLVQCIDNSKIWT